MSLFKAPYGVGEGLKCHYVTVCLSESLTAEMAQDSQSRQGQVRCRSECMCVCVHWGNYTVKRLKPKEK